MRGCFTRPHGSARSQVRRKRASDARRSRVVGSGVAANCNKSNCHKRALWRISSGMNNLRNTIDGLATQFAASLLDALRSASIDELVAVARGGNVRRSGRAKSEAEAPAAAAPRRRGGRLGRRSPDDIGKMIDGIVDLLAKSPEGLRAEQLRAELGVESKELPRPLAQAVAAGRITKSGQKRATTYFAAGEGGARKRAGRRTAKKR